MAAQIGPFKLGKNVLEINAIGITSPVRTGAGTFSSDYDIARTLDGRPAHLYISEEHHPVGAPVLD